MYGTKESGNGCVKPQDILHLPVKTEGNHKSIKLGFVGGKASITY
jgi:hypothetical protein